MLHPIGFDSFGLPAENAAIKKGVKPDKWTYSNIKEMEVQLRELGFSYDWDREVSQYVIRSHCAPKVGPMAPSPSPPPSPGDDVPYSDRKSVV